MTHPRIPAPFRYTGRLDGGRYGAEVALSVVTPLPRWRRLAVRVALLLAAVVGRRDRVATDRAPGRALRRVALRLTLSDADCADTGVPLNLARWQDGAVGTVLAAQLRAEGMPLTGLRPCHLLTSSDGASVVFSDDGRPADAVLCLR